jgi:hypothetical protein
MKKIVLVLAMFFSTSLSAHKKHIDRFEVSISVVSVNIGRSHLIFNNQFEILNSIHVKYFQKKIGYRVSGSYLRHVHHFPFHDCNGIIENSNSLRLSAGIQVQVVKQLKWLYAFSDLGFRRLKGTGYYGAYYPSPFPVAVELTRLSLGAELQSGVGMKLRLGNHFRFFTEAGVSVVCLANTYTYPFRPQSWELPDDKTSSAVGSFGRLGFSVAF